MESSGFFDAELISEEEGYDRVYVAEQFAKYFAMFVGNGVFADSNMLQVIPTETEGMSVKMKSGKAWINGYWYNNDSDKTFRIAPADGTFSRYDAIVVRFDTAKRKISAEIVKGELATNPKYPTCLRTADYFDLVLCYISIPKGTVKITNSLIIDKRLDKSVCGQVEALIKQPDVSQYGSQLNNFIAEYISTSNKTYETFEGLLMELKDSYDELCKVFQKESEDEFKAWFDSIKGQLSEDAAGNLQLQVDELYERTDENDLVRKAKGNTFKIMDSQEGQMFITDVALNLLDVDIVTSTTKGVTFTVNDDGTIIANGTATDSILLAVNQTPIQLEKGDYNFSGCPNGGASTVYCIQPVVNGAWMPWFDVGQGMKISMSNDFTLKLIIHIEKGVVCNNLVFKPMLNIGIDKREFVPYDEYKLMVTGRNLLDFDKFEDTYKSNGRIILQATEEDKDIVTKTSNLIDLGFKVGREYSISFEAVATANTNLFFDLFPDTISGAFSNAFVVVTQEPTRFTLTGILEGSFEDSIILRIWKKKEFKGSEVTISNIQIEVGEPTPYTPYKGYEVVKINHTTELPFTMKSYGTGTSVISEYDSYVEVIYDKSDKFLPVTDYAKKLENLKASLSDIIIAVLKDNWVYNSARKLYINRIDIKGISENDTPIYGLHCSSNEPTNDELVAYMNIEDLIAYDGYVELTSKVKINSSFSVILKCTNGSGDSVIANFDKVMANIQKMENDISSLNQSLNKIKVLSSKTFVANTEGNSIILNDDITHYKFIILLTDCGIGTYDTVIGSNRPNLTPFTVTNDSSSIYWYDKYHGTFYNKIIYCAIGISD